MAPLDFTRVCIYCECSKPLSDFSNKDWLGRKHSEETKALLSEMFKGRKFSGETLVKMSASHVGRKLPDETRAAMSAAKRGRTLSEEHKAACREGWAKRKALLVAGTV